MKNSPCRICGSNSKLIVSDLYDDRHGYVGKFSEYQCEECGFISIDLIMKSSDIGEVYKNYYPVETLTPKLIKLVSKIPDSFSRFFTGLNYLPAYQIKGNNLDILDYGSSSGKNMLKLQKMGHNVIGLDPDSKANEKGRKLGLDVRVGFIDDLEKNLRFDYILLAQVLEHEPEPINLIQKLSKRLKSNGKIIFSSPHGDSIFRKIFGKNWIHWHVPYHLNHFTKRSAEILAKKSKLKINKLQTITPNAWTGYQFYRFLNRVEEGTPDPFWGETPRTEGRKVNLLGKLSHLISMTNFYSLSNRIIDFLGFGDAIVVELENPS